MGSVKALCHSGLLLEKGMVKYSGNIEDTINEYLSANSSEYGIPINQRKDRFGIGGLQVNDIYITTLNDETISNVMSGQNFKIKFKYESTLLEPQKNIILSVLIKDENGTDLSLIHNRLTGQPFTVKKGTGVFELIVKKNPLNSGLYTISYTILGNNGQLPYIDGINAVLKLKVQEGDFYNSGELAPRSFGPILIDSHFNNIQ
jgi:lipopolysaccharide transport system ATP-binding protein